MINTDVLATINDLPLTRLVHFTPSRNLPHILRDGALRGSEEMSADQRACFSATDLGRLDNNPDKISCSFEYPNSYYLPIAQRKTQFVNFPDWTLILINKTAAAVTGTKFCPRNSAAGYGSFAKEGSDALLDCFATEVAGQGGQIRARSKTHDPRCATDVQAEVLIPGPISLASIIGFAFPTVEAAQQEVGRLMQVGLTLPEVPVVLAADLFDKFPVSHAIQGRTRIVETLWKP